MKHFIIILALLTVFSSFAGSVEAKSGQTYKVGASSLNVRNKPSIRAAVIGSLPEGSQINVSEIKYGWAHVDYNGNSGWVASQFLYKSNGSSNVTSHQQVTVIASNVNVRSGPGTDYLVIGMTDRGRTYQQIGSDHGWVEVQFNNGKGWIAGWLVTSGKVDTRHDFQTGSIAGKTIVVDAGHGGFDSGAIGYRGTLEKKSYIVHIT